MDKEIIKQYNVYFSIKWHFIETTLKFCTKNKMEFIILFPKDIDNFFKTYERDSLNFIER